MKRTRDNFIGTERDQKQKVEDKSKDVGQEVLHVQLKPSSMGKEVGVLHGVSLGRKKKI